MTTRVVPMLICMVAMTATAQSDDLGIRAPEGFEVSLYAGDELAHDIYSMTVDARGRVVVAGSKYVKTLHDDDGDGRADRATLFSATPASGAHGMVFDGDELICTGDNAVRRLRDADGDGRADGPGEVWAKLRHPEHGANGVVRGPDGWYYVICGNDAGVSREHAQSPGSPVREPRCGAVVRFSPDGKRSEVVAHGFRNPYDADFLPSGELLLVDADGERDHRLPWYAPNRLFDVAQGREHGWILQGWQRSWNRPAALFDSGERLVEIGRGSPTGAVTYRHRQFPDRYRGGFFTLCWTLGRVYFIPTARHEASFNGQVEIFLETTGDVGFAPVDIAVAPSGEMFVAVGGRGTRGSVFRVRHAATTAVEQREIVTVEGVIAADQPQASWSRARWLPAARRLGAAEFEKLLADTRQSAANQVRAVEILTDVFDGLPVEVAQRALALGRPELSARVAWALGRRAYDAPTIALLSNLTWNDDPLVQRFAWESLATAPEALLLALPEGAAFHWDGAADSNVRRVRSAALDVAAGPGRMSFEQAMSTDEARLGPRQRLATLRVALASSDGAAVPEKFSSQCVELLPSCSQPVDQLEAIRLLQLALGDMRVQPGQAEVYSGYSANAPDQIPADQRSKIAVAVAAEFPTGNAEVDRELARLASMLALETPGMVEKISSRWTTASTVEDDIHYLIVLSRLPGARSRDVTHATAAALAGLHAKLAAGNTHADRNWPDRLLECFAGLQSYDRALVETLVADRAFGRPEHALFANAIPDDQRRVAARRMLAALDAATKSGDEEEWWTPEVVQTLGSLDSKEIAPRLRTAWDESYARDAIAAVLARDPRAEDRERFVESLQSLQAGVVAPAADALLALPAPGTSSEIAAALAALARLCELPDERRARETLAKLLRHWTGQTIDVDDSQAKQLAVAYRPWFVWFENAYPDAAKELARGAGADLDSWLDRLAKVDWSAGDARRGRAAFEKASCHRCHLGNSRLGPDLAGAAGRFARDDLFVTILDPSRQVSPTYQTSSVTTRSGQIHTGMMVYESADGVLLQTGADTTVRIAGSDLAGTVPSRQSLMPVGLLNQASDQDLADLYAFLKTLTAEKK